MTSLQLFYWVINASMKSAIVLGCMSMSGGVSRVQLAVRRNVKLMEKESNMKNNEKYSKSKMKNIHILFEKPAEYKPYEFAKVNGVALFWQLLSSILITNFSLMLKYIWTWPFSFARKIKGIVFFNNVLFFTPLPYAQSLKRGFITALFGSKIMPM